MTLGQFSMTLYLPSLPALAQYFQVSASSVQLSLINFLLAFALSQFFYGALSDKYGRKRLLLIGILICIIGTALIIFSKNIIFFNFSRFIQGFGSGAIASLSRAIIRDKYTGKELDISMSYVVMSVAVTPIIAPILGGVIQEYFGWKSVFGVLLIYAIVVEIIIYLFLPETKNLKEKNKKDISYSQGYKIVFSSSTYLIFIACIVICYSCQLLYLLISPFIFQTQLHISVDKYGLIMMFPALAYFFGNIICNRLINHIQTNFLMMAGAIIIICSGIYMFFFLNIASDSVVHLVTPIVIAIFGVSFIYSNAMSGCLKPFPHVAGIASAMSVFLQMLGSGLIIKAINFFHMESINTLGVAFAFLGMAILFFLFLNFYRVRKKIEIILVQ